MEIDVKRWPVAGGPDWALLWLDDRLDVVCSLAVPHDAIPDWQGAWLVRAAQDAGLIDRLAANAEDLFQLDPLACPPTVIRALYGLVDFLQCPPCEDEDPASRAAAATAIREFLAERFAFGSLRSGDLLGMQIVVAGDRYPLLGADPTRAESWLAAFFKWAGGQNPGYRPAGGADAVESTVESYEFLYAAARQQRDESTLAGFVAFSRALAERLERDDRYQPYRRRLDEIYKTIVCHACDLNRARDGLLRLLAGPDSMADKWPRMSELIHDLKRNGNGEDPAARDDGERLATLTGLIADRYLENYDLNRTVAAWRQLSLRDPLLGTLLALMHRPGAILAFHGGAFLLLLVLARLRAGRPGPLYVGFPWLGPLPLFRLLGGLLLLLLVAGPLWVAGSVVVNLVRSRLYYAQLVLPRMLGAIVVGLSVLMLDDLPWRLTLRLPLLTLLLLMAGVYFLSFLYVLLDVYQTVRFEPVAGPGISAADAPGRRPSTLGYATHVALRVFAIGIVQSFLATLCVSGLMLPIVFQEVFAPAPYPWLDSPLGWLAFGPAGSAPVFVFVPALVLLWTGMALFIGAFLQLLWQDSRVTSPVRG